MKHILTITAIALLFVLSCKKKETNNNNNNQSGTTTGGTTTGGTTTGGASTGGPVLTNTATSFNMFLSTTTGTFDMNGVAMTQLSASAYFYLSKASFPGNMGVRAGIVKLNGDSLAYLGNSGYHSFQTIDNSKAVWEVSGANGFPAFTFSTGLTQPTADNLQMLPKTISKSAGLSLTIANLKNYKTGQFMIMDHASSTTGIVYRSVSGTALQLNLTPADLAPLATGTTGIISFLLSNEVKAAVGDKDIKATKDLTVVKSLTITP